MFPTTSPPSGGGKIADALIDGLGLPSQILASDEQLLPYLVKEGLPTIRQLGRLVLYVTSSGANRLTSEGSTMSGRCNSQMTANPKGTGLLPG